ncbi:KpsF/GutQ family sugar-phosphate isomerase [Vibrio parahaemolyticus]|uniref:KpsF/GutQ family sugar-phosphate isomerase n=1 Tax=Vibrio parahaemolyticus TaxID=670 RepID=UPI00084A9766|nr:KpsF/GutQ family sugar-phosphate isomerase [Vibrio parahaemolyticus]EGQ8219528.1 KpsF/GutQ family sugar-phosphate isomerase [Vibrio parahaemolyticus]EGQ8795796.1 KpsF/GutQ family sugar-phosphate isomerase [Vibrio parahaemolyticus]EGR2253867.1 KpsF/GutQ family sugar-phosphate isomerase [Vibrio parahaemolyticus]EGU8226343.1 KpsF/GutQ family sugar-phosphate isomerase [Vibrio parahaemolyticus]EHK2886098.1 KpsF/GutQ family sugar-phosphate isomerase [Vibrio parahaemolyticus]
MDIIKIAKDVIQTEVDGLIHMGAHIDNSFIQAVNAILTTHGRTIICGMGKSGIVGKKIAASFASTGTPSFFMHPGEAFHGDLGMVKPEDVFIAISNSGETDEVLKLLPFLRDNGNYVIALTGKSGSTLAKNAHCHLDIAVPKEACPHQLAPTSSTTATLVMGDALTVALMESREFLPENFARFHPGGSLGRRLLSRVSDEMVSEFPVVKESADFTSVVHAISDGKLGLVLVEVDQGLAIITDGDVRKAMNANGKQVFDLKARDILTLNPAKISGSASTQSAYEVMENKKITSLIVVEGERVIGVLKK